MTSQRSRYYRVSDLNVATESRTDNVGVQVSLGTPANPYFSAGFLIGPSAAVNASEMSPIGADSGGPIY